MKRMKLVELEKFQEEEIEIQSPQENEVLIRVKKVGICGSDISAYYGKHPYIKAPIVLGHEFSGIVEKVGDSVKEIEIGAKVTVLPHLGCGNCEACRSGKYNLCEELKVIGCQSDGAHAQYITVPENIVFKLPETISLEQGAFIEPASVGYHGVKRGIKKGDNVLIMGAGPIGIFALQAASVLGASRIVIADLKKERLDLAKSLSKCDIIDLSEEDIENGLERILGDSKNIDLFCDCVGGKGNAFNKILEIARRGTRIVSIGIIGNNYNIPRLPDMIEHEITVFGSSMFVPQDFWDVIALMSKGKIKINNMITHQYDLQNIPEIYKMIERKKENYFKILINI